MKKHKLAVIILFIIGTLPVAAQDKASSLSSRSPFIMSFSIGPNFNTGGSEHIGYFGSRADVATQFDWRIAVGFARHWNAYLDIGFKVGECLFYRVYVHTGVGGNGPYRRQL